MKIMILVKTVLLVFLTLIVMIMLMPAMIFGGTKFIGEVYRVFTKEFRKIHGLDQNKVKA